MSDYNDLTVVAINRLYVAAAVMGAPPEEQEVVAACATRVLFEDAIARAIDAGAVPGPPCQYAPQFYFRKGRPYGRMDGLTVLTGVLSPIAPDDSAEVTDAKWVAEERMAAVLGPFIAHTFGAVALTVCGVPLESDPQFQQA
jgi:hypothetical protein